MKSRKSKIHTRVHAIPEIQFDDGQSMTPYAGAVLFQALFQKLRFKERLRDCFSHQGSQAIFGCPMIVMLMVVHLLLGFRKIRGLDYYREDPLISRILGVSILPDVSTVSRSLGQADAVAVIHVRKFSKDLVLDRLVDLNPKRVTLDFDGSVLSTLRKAEGSAVGYNKKKKGARSYYPLYCTTAQTGQILDLHHRSGNIHDSKGAMQFMRGCIFAVRRALPKAQIEVRIDGAFFSERLLVQLDELGVKFTASVPFERLSELKTIVESRKRWESVGEDWSAFECDWRPKSWSHSFRFVASRQLVRAQDKAPIQLDLFAPRPLDCPDWNVDFRVIVTNYSKLGLKQVLDFHHGRACQEQVFAETKTIAQMDYVPFKRLIPNQLYCLSAILAHNLSRELQMQAVPTAEQRPQSAKRNALFGFQTLATIRQNLIHRAGIFKRPQGRLTLVLNANPAVESELRRYLGALQPAA